MRAPVRLHEALLAALLICRVAEAPAQTRPATPWSKATLPGRTTLPTAVLDTAVDVLHYDIDLTLGMQDGSLRGRVTLQLRASSPGIDLHAAALQIDSVTVNGGPATWDSIGTEMIRVNPGLPVSPGESLSVTISYRRLQGRHRPAWRDGYYWFSRDSVTGLPATVGYTMSEPSDARYWLPCHDEPWDKATADLSITVPDGMLAASNGRLLETRTNGDGTVTWRWREGHPIAPYLLCITASAFVVSELPYARAAGDTIPLQYFTWREDSTQCATFLPTVRTMMTFLTSRFGPYPFDKYGMTAIVPFAFGGMEHQTITTMHRVLMTHPDVVVHELAHQWWGDLVTCAAWEDIWLNEGFASYCEALWEESQGGSARLNQYLNTDFNDFNTASWEGAIYAPVSQGFDMFSSAVYSKAAWVLHTLRGVLGDTLFLRSFAAYRARYSGGNATTDQFRAVVDSVAGRDMRWFFQEWIYGRGWPEYAYTWGWGADTLRVTIWQVQKDPTWPVFAMPVQLRATFASGDTVLTVRDSLRVQEFAVGVPRQPVGLEFDPFNRILKRMAGPVTGVRPESLPGRMALDQNFPNPFNSSTSIVYEVSGFRDQASGAGSQLPLAGRVKLAVYDLLGREVVVLVDQEMQPGRYTVKFSARGGSASGGDGSALASGVYIYRLTAGGSTVNRKMILMR